MRAAVATDRSAGPGLRIGRRAACRTPAPTGGCAAVRQDRALLRFALTASPAILLITQAVVVVPLALSSGRLTTLFLSTGAVCAATAQCPLWRSTLARHGLPLGFSSFAAAYALFIPSAVLPAGISRTTLVVLAGALYGLAQGALLSALFHQTRRLAPPGLTGAYFGAINFVSRMAALIVGAAIGLLLDHGPGGTVAALTGLAGLAALAANATARRPPRRTRFGIVSCADPEHGKPIANRLVIDPINREERVGC